MHDESLLEHDGIQHGSEALHDIGRHQYIHVFFQMPFGILWEKKPGKRGISDLFTFRDDVRLGAWFNRSRIFLSWK